MDRSLKECFSTSGYFAPRGTFGNIWGRLELSQTGQCYWHLVGTRDASKHPTKHRTAPIRKNYLASDGAKVEKP